MAWIYIILLFFLLLALIYMRYKNKYVDPFGNLSLPQNSNRKKKETHDSN